MPHSFSKEVKYLVDSGVPMFSLPQRTTFFLLTLELWLGGRIRLTPLNQKQGLLV